MPASPIFIAGCARSGTTLLRRMLDRHPALAIFGETQFHLLVFRAMEKRPPCTPCS
jgi:Sulfotransferase family